MVEVGFVEGWEEPLDVVVGLLEPGIILVVGLVDLIYCELVAGNWEVVEMEVDVVEFGEVGREWRRGLKGG